MGREEKISMFYGIGGWFLLLHFAVVIVNNIVTQLSSFLLLKNTSVIDSVLIRNSILSVFIYGMSSIFMILISLALLLNYYRRLKNNYLKSIESSVDAIENRYEEVRFVVFSVVGMLILLMSINSIIAISAYHYESLAGLLSFKLSDAYFRYSLLLVGPQYLLSLGEALLGLWLLKKFSEKTLKSDK